VRKRERYLTPDRNRRQQMAAILSYLSRILTAVLLVTVITAVIPVIALKKAVNTTLFVGTSELV
jgi:hypothetical protein